MIHFKWQPYLCFLFQNLVGIVIHISLYMGIFVIHSCLVPIPYACDCCLKFWMFLHLCFSLNPRLFQIVVAHRHKIPYRWFVPVLISIVLFLLDYVDHFLVMTIFTISLSQKDKFHFVVITTSTISLCRTPGERIDF